MKRTYLCLAITLLAVPAIACDGLFSQMRQNRIERIQSRSSYGSTGGYAASSGSFAQSSGSFATTYRVVIRRQAVAVPLASPVYEGVGCTNCQ